MKPVLLLDRLKRVAVLRLKEKRRAIKDMRAPTHIHMTELVLSPLVKEGL